MAIPLYNLDDFSKEEIAAAFVDALDGNQQWHEIQYFTGLPQERCEAISEMFKQLTRPKKEGK